MIGGAVVVLSAGVLVALPDIVALLKTYEIHGTITWIDYGRREASLEFKHPRSGLLRETTRPVPPDCPITLGGSPGRLEDLRVGDRVTVRGKWNRRTKEVRILAIARDQVAQNSAAAVATLTTP